MSRPDLFIEGQCIELIKRIGKGGEGEVYLVAGAAQKAVKLYTGASSPDREAKVRAMVRDGLAKQSSLVSFPQEIVTTKSGQFVGFSMRLVEGFRELHQLYGPKSRKIHYPKADFRFLVRVALNTARAVGQVHSSPCIIGDLNESGILVSSKAIVALIDADSFQFETGERVYPCLVGKPDFTAPELHGKPLTGVKRTKAHDQFGLAVVIFQLLFMGRHPYAGQQKGVDLSLDQMIAANMFAYSKRRQTGAAPPGVLPSLNDFPNDIADGFERAFGNHPAQRPSATEWVNLLQGLEQRLSRCSNDPMHFYPSVAKSCPWCRMEGATGAVLFLSTVVVKAAATVGIENFDADKTWQAIKSVILPDPNTITPKLPAFSTKPSAEAQAENSRRVKHKLFAAAVAGMAIVGWFNIPDAAVLWIGVLVFAWFQFIKTSIDGSEWQSRYSAIDQKWDEAITTWRNVLGITDIVKLRDDLEAAVREYRGLPAAKSQAMALLKTERRTHQLNDYLDRFLIRRASISGIGQAKVITLASFGIESAADIKRNAILSIPGFGPATTDKLMAWRNQHERRFVYNPAPNQSDMATQKSLDSEYANRAMILAKKISGGQVELQQVAKTLQQRLTIEDHRLSGLATKRMQLEVDLTFLGISKPYKPKLTATSMATPRPVAPVRTTTISSGVTCPNCNAPMVHRVARRGHRRGNQFWGCSRYPSCRGTRP